MIEAKIKVRMSQQDAHYAGAKKIGRGKGYKYPHEFKGNFVEENYLPEELSDLIVYVPTENGAEKKIKERLERLWKKRQKNPGTERSDRD